MKIPQIVHLALLILILAECRDPRSGTIPASGQEKRLPGPPSFARVKSPEFNPDSSITFRIWAPKATEVKLECAGLVGDQSDLLERFDGEYWRITVKPASSGLFKYRFMVDGVQTPDPLNAITSGNSSILMVAGRETDFFEIKDVPHGSLHKHFYHNPDIEAVRTCLVYTPAEYKSHPEKKYPVLLLFHGSGGTDESWFREGKANVILDNLIAEKKACPMIAVAPYGHTVEPGSHNWPFVQEQGDFIQDFNEVLLPLLKSNYRLSDDPYQWALAGFSMGGYHTLKIGLHGLDRFGHIGPFSWGGDQEFFEQNFPHILQNPEWTNARLRSFFMACGQNDFLYDRVVKMDSLLSAAGIEHTFYTTDGGHTMRNWRKFLYQYAQVIFQD